MKPFGPHLWAAVHFPAALEPGRLIVARGSFARPVIVRPILRRVRGIGHAAALVRDAFLCTSARLAGSRRSAARLFLSAMAIAGAILLTFVITLIGDRLARKSKFLACKNKDRCDKGHSALSCVV
jgi:hypothetical protein